MLVARSASGSQGRSYALGFGYEVKLRPVAIMMHTANRLAVVLGSGHSAAISDALGSGMGVEFNSPLKHPLEVT